MSGGGNEFSGGGVCSRKSAIFRTIAEPRKKVEKPLDKQLNICYNSHTR